MQDALEQRYALIDELLTGTFNSVLRIEERVLENKLTRGLTITEIHAIVAVGYRESNPMNVVAARLGVTLATLTTTAARLEEKGYVVRTRDERDRRKAPHQLDHAWARGVSRPRLVPQAHGAKRALGPQRRGAGGSRPLARAGEGLLRRASLSEGAASRAIRLARPNRFAAYGGMRRAVAAVDAARPAVRDLPRARRALSLEQLDELLARQARQRERSLVSDHRGGELGFSLLQA